jgi:hypothetical protein
MSIYRVVPILISVLAIVSLGSGLAQATTQEAFICSLKEGKTVEDLMKVGSQFKKAIADVKGGGAYTAQVLVPIASQNLNTVIWIGHMPSFAAMAAFNDAYVASAVSKKFDPMFEAVADCESRSFWQVQDVK